MNKLIIFDFDGVLYDGKKIHFDSLNYALQKIDQKYVISKKEHKQIYDGLSTKEKLKILSEKKKLDPKHYELIWENKQHRTLESFKNINKDQQLIDLLSYIKANNIFIALASNSISTTVHNALKSLGIYELFDLIISNEDVSLIKPNPEMFLKAMSDLNIDVNNTVIFEDSKYGFIAAKQSGAKLIKIKNRKDLNFKKINKAINYLLKENNV